ncbi:hypothetical protein KIL84_022528 [Mauremys mutica]|uniref:Uncharacterized protein n=1 Tax=Mauremys mutica TaxID=74926 RepID=A0A9D4AP31_9SAUR|nr:hypothetical protein KIL84_022528 [Mauremys mutica]
MEGEIPKKSLDRVRARSTSHPISTAVMRLLGQSDCLSHVAGAASGKVPGMDIAQNIDMKVTAVILSPPEPRCRDNIRRVHGTPCGNGTNNRFAQAPLKCCYWAELAEWGSLELALWFVSPEPYSRSWFVACDDAQTGGHSQAT